MTEFQRKLRASAVRRCLYRKVRLQFFRIGVNNTVYHRGRNAPGGRCIGPARRGRNLALLTVIRNQLYREVIAAALQIAAVEAEPRRMAKPLARTFRLLNHRDPLVAFINRLLFSNAIEVHHGVKLRRALVLEMRHAVFRVAVPALVPDQIGRRGQAVRKLLGTGDLACGDELPLAVDRLRVLCHRDVAAVDHYSNAIPALAVTFRAHRLVHGFLGLVHRVEVRSVRELFLAAALFAVHIRAVFQNELRALCVIRSHQRKVRHQLFLVGIDDAVYLGARNTHTRCCIGPVPRGRQFTFFCARNQFHHEEIAAALQFAAVKAEPRRMATPLTRPLRLFNHLNPLVAFENRLFFSIAIETHHCVKLCAALVLEVCHAILRPAVPALIPDQIRRRGKRVGRGIRLAAKDQLGVQKWVVALPDFDRIPLFLGAGIVHRLKIHAAGEGIGQNPGSCDRDRDLRQACVVREGALADLFQIGGQIDRTQAAAAFKAGILNGPHIVGNRDARQTGTGKSRTSDLFQAVRQRDRGQVGAAFKTRIRDGPHIVRNRDARQTGTRKSRASDLFQAVRQCDLRQAGAAFKPGIGNASHALRQAHTGDAGKAAEGLRADAGHPVGEHHRGNPVFIHLPGAHAVGHVAGAGEGQNTGALIKAPGDVVPVDAAAVGEGLEPVVDACIVVIRILNLERIVDIVYCLRHLHARHLQGTGHGVRFHMAVGIVDFPVPAIAHVLTLRRADRRFHCGRLAGLEIEIL